MSSNVIQDAGDIASRSADLAQDMTTLARNIALQAGDMASSGGGHGSFVVMGLTIFVLACFVGYHVVWRVTPALHSPLMAVTNAISSVVIVGAIIAAGPDGFSFSKLLGFLGIVLASINIFGGFIVTRRMLSMFKAKTHKK